MAAAPVESGQDDRFSVQIKLSDQIADQPGTDERMIDGAENYSLGFDTLQASYPRANGRELALLPIRVQNGHGGLKLRDGPDFVGAGAKHDASHADARMAR